MLPGARTRNACVRPWRRCESGSLRFAEAYMRTRRAKLPDAQRIHDLILAYSRSGTLLPRTLAEVCENVRDFVVAEHRGRIIGCGALHLYGQHLTEIRSICVDPEFKGHGA